MSMFNDVANRLAKKARSEAINRLTQTAGNLVRGSLANSFLPILAQKVNAFGANQLLSKTTKPQNSTDIAAAVERFKSTENPLLGGVKPGELYEVFEQVKSQKYSKKNLWLLEISSRLNSGAQNVPKLFNLFATSVSYTHGTISGEATKIGAANYDVVQGVEPVELTITAYDDATGTLKKWFSAHQAAAVASDGTIAEPDAYAITVRILHGFVKRPDSTPYENVGLFRPVSMELSLDRHEDGLEEITMQFAQLDTFMRP